MEKLVSIVIPNFNGRHLLRDCLESIKRQTYQNYEIIIVDDASTDNSVEYLSDFPAKVLVNDVNKGFAASVNRGILASQGEYILLLNNDVVLKEDFLEKQLQAAKRSRKIFSVSPKMIRFYERDLLDDTGDEYTVYGWVYKRGDGESIQLYNKADSVFSACAGAGLYQSTVLREIGLLDELHFAYLEDVDLGWRARIAGYENVYEPEAVCYHIGSATLAEGQKYSDKKVNLSARNNIYIIYKNMPFLQILLNLPTLLVGFGVKWLYFRRRGFGQEYTSGLLEGIRKRKLLKRVPYKKENLKNYINIQKRMISCSVKYTALKLSKLVFNKAEQLIANFNMLKKPS